MPQQHDKSITRKLSKMREQNGGFDQDFIAERCAENIMGCVLQSDRLVAPDVAKALLLYERNVRAAECLGSVAQDVDQVPFDMLSTSPANLMAMLPSEQYDVVISNLAFDWLDAGGFIRLLHYLLRPDGMFWFSCYGPLTALRARAVLADIDSCPHFNDFYDLRDVGDALLGAGFKDVVLESSILNLEYDSVDAVLADAVRAFGVNLHPERRNVITPVRVLDAFKAEVEREVRLNGKFVEQVEILIAHGKKPRIAGMTGVIPVR